MSVDDLSFEFDMDDIAKLLRLDEKGNLSIILNKIIIVLLTKKEKVPPTLSKM